MYKIIDIQSSQINIRKIILQVFTENNFIIESRMLSSWEIGSFSILSILIFCAKDKLILVSESFGDNFFAISK